MELSSQLQKSNFFNANDDFQDIIKRHTFSVDKNVIITPSSHGKSSFVFFVIDNAEEYVYKFPRTSFSIKTIYKEQSVTNILRSHLCCQIPDICIENHSGRVFSVYKKIKGENMSDFTLDESEMYSLAQELAKFIFDFHSIPIESVSYNVGTKRESVELFCKDFGYSPRFDNIADILDERTLIHGDYHRSNIILKDKKLNGILDFSTVSIGSKYFDIGHMMFSMDDKFNRLFIGEYEKAADKKMDRDKIKRVISFLDDMINKNYLPFIRRTRNVQNRSY